MSNINRKQEFITELYGRIQWMEGSLEDCKYITEIWNEADELIDSGNIKSIEAGIQTQKKLLDTDLDEINMTEIDDIGTMMNIISNEEV